MAESEIKRIIVATEKHTTRYLDASTDEMWAKSALMLLSERFKEGFWYYDPNENLDESETKTRQELLNMSQATLAALPETVRTEVAKKIDEAKRDLLDEQEQAREYFAIKRAVEAQDLSWVGKGRYSRPLAWALLERRSEAEYERVALEDVEIPGAEEVSL